MPAPLFPLAPALETAGVRRRLLPQVGQAGVVPQSLCKGLRPFVADLVAPHPAIRGKTADYLTRIPCVLLVAMV